MTEFTYIGFVDSIGKEHKTATLVPLLKYEDDLIRIGDTLVGFPSRGKIIWFNPSTVQAGSLWRFRIRECPSFDPSSHRYDQYMVDGSPDPMMDIVATFKNEETARQSLSDGVLLAHAPDRRVYLRIGVDTLLGPIEVTQISANRYRFDPAANDSQVHVFRIDPGEVVSAEHNDWNWSFISPLYALPPKTGDLDWGTDEDVLRRAMRLAPKYSPQLYQDIKLSERIIRQLADATVSANLPLVEADRLRRSAQIVAEGNASIELIRQLVDDWLKLPKVATLLAEEAQKTRERTKAETEAKVLASLTEQRNEQARLHVEIQQLHESKQDLEKQIQHERTRKQEFCNSLEENVRHRLQDIASEPTKFLAEITVLRPFLQAMNEPVTRAQVSAPLLVRPPEDPVTRPLKNDTGPIDVSKCVTEVFSTYGLNPWIGSLIHASLLAGLPPCLFGRSARLTLQAYAEALFAGTALEVPVHAGILGVDDLLNQANGTVRHFLAAAGQSDRMHLLFIEGVNRTLVESSVAPFTQAVVSTTHPNWPTPILADWPRNVLVATTLSESNAAMPVPPSLWDSSTLVAVDDVQSNNQRSIKSAESAALAITTWEQLIAECRANSEVCWRGWLKEKAPNASISATTALKADRFSQAARTVLGSDADALAATIAVCLSPVLARLTEAQRGPVLRILGHEPMLTSVIQRVLELDKLSES